MNTLILQSSRSSNLRSSLLARTSSAPQPLPTSLSTQLIQTLGDNSCPYIRQKNIYDIVAQLTSRMTIIRPENKWLLAWHVLVMGILLYYIFEIGLLWGYGQAVWVDELAVLYALNCIFILILIADIFLCNLKAYYSHGLLVVHPRLIVKRYLKLRFYIDVIAVISIMIPFISGKFALNWIKALFFLKLYSVYEIDKQFIRVSQLKVSYHTFYLLSRLVLLLILGSHYLGIWFYMIDYWVYENNYYGPNTPNICWIYNAQAYSQLVLLLPWYGQYLYTMYFSIGTMTTIAYGDITPLNPLQTIYITFALIAYTIGFAYILSQILRILMQAQASKFEHTNNLLIVSNMMKNNMIKQKTQSKVKSYFQKVWKQQIYRNRQVQTQLIQQLPQKIRNQLFSQLYTSFFTSILLYYPGSQCTVRTNFMVAIANQVRQHRLVQDHILYKENQEYDPQNLNNHIFYFVKQLKKGKLKPSIQIGVRDLTIKTFTQGNVGIEGFYTGDPRDHWAKVILSVLVYQLPRKVLLDNIHLATQAELQNIFLICQTIYTKSCYICTRIGHNFKQCQYVTYQPNKKQLLKYYLSGTFLKPNQYTQNNNKQSNILSYIGNKRKQRISYNTLTIFKDIKNNKYKIRDKYQMMMHNKYYRQLFSMAKKKSKNKKQNTHDDLDVFYHLLGGGNLGESANNLKSSKQLKSSRESIRKTIKMDKLQKKQMMKLSPKLSPRPSPLSKPKQKMNILQQEQQFRIQIQPTSQIVHPSHKQDKQHHRHKQQKKERQQHEQPYRRRTTVVPHSKLKHAQTYIPKAEVMNLQSSSSSDTSSDTSSSSEESVDLQNYVKQTELYIRTLEQLQTNAEAEGVSNSIYNQDMQYDVAKEYHIYHPSSNLHAVILKFNEEVSAFDKRRKVERIYYRGATSERSDRRMLNDSIDEVSERSVSMRDGSVSKEEII